MELRRAKTGYEPRAQTPCTYTGDCTAKIKKNLACRSLLASYVRSYVHVASAVDAMFGTVGLCVATTT